jgi:hypothetical protein
MSSTALKTRLSSPAVFLPLLLALLGAGVPARAELRVIGVQYQSDRVFPEYECLWHDRQYPGPCSPTVPGANVKVFVKNTGAATESLNDVTLAGYSLKTVIAMNPNESDASSIYFYWSTPPQTILNAGEPVWFKAEPASLPVGAVGQAVVRLRYLPKTSTVTVGVVGAGNTVTTNITVDAAAPQLASIGFAADRTQVYLHWRRAGGAAPVSVWMDGVNVTANTTTVGDPAVNFAASTLQLASPLEAMSFHVYQGVYADGKIATAGVRTWVNPFLYGTRGFLSDLSGTNLYNVIAGGAQASCLSGVGYRFENGQKEVILSGLSSGWNTDYMTTNGTAFGGKRRDTNIGRAPTAVQANGLAGTTSEVFYSTWFDADGSSNRLYIGRFSGAWAASPVWDKTAPGTTLAQTHGISATGRAVGFLNANKSNYVLDWTGTGVPQTWSFNGLNGTSLGEAWAISADGTVIFGQSPVSDGRPGNWAYKAVVTSDSPGTLQSIHELPNFPETVGTAGNAALPYGCTADGNYAVGMSYRSAERAVLWDTHDPNAANWTMVDLTDLAQANGALGLFSRLTRAYSIGTNNPGELVIAGAGLDHSTPANTRAFVITVDSPNGLTVPRPVVAISTPYPAEFQFTFPTVANSGLGYYLEYTTTLGPQAIWTPLTSTPGTGTNADLFDLNPSGQQRFYRIRVQ